MNRKQRTRQELCATLKGHHFGLRKKIISKIDEADFDRNISRFARQHFPSAKKNIRDARNKKME